MPDLGALSGMLAGGGAAPSNAEAGGLGNVIAQVASSPAFQQFASQMLGGGGSGGNGGGGGGGTGSDELPDMGRMMSSMMQAFAQPTPVRRSQPPSPLPANRFPDAWRSDLTSEELEAWDEILNKDAEAQKHLPVQPELSAAYLAGRSASADATGASSSTMPSARPRP